MKDKDKDKDKDKTSGSNRHRRDIEVAWGAADSMLGEKTEKREQKPRVVACEACTGWKRGLPYCLKRGCR